MNMANLMPHKAAGGMHSTPCLLLSRPLQFTGVAATEKIPAGAEAAILYTFVPHESFDSRDYGLTVLIDYEMVCVRTGLLWKAFS
jgi:hypothetical protein